MIADPIDLMLTPISVALRTYSQEHHTHAHNFEQFVLPLSGTLEIEVGGKGSRLTPGLAAFVSRGSNHSQWAQGKNQFLIVDVHTEAMDVDFPQTLNRSPFFHLSTAAEHLIQYLSSQVNLSNRLRTLEHWLPLFLETLQFENNVLPSRLTHVLKTVDAQLSKTWTTSEMAQLIYVSPSRLHVMFRDSLNTTPIAWIAQRRLDQVRILLSDTSMSIAQISERVGYSDQSALSRAFRTAIGLTPKEYRQLRQQPESKRQ